MLINRQEVLSSCLDVIDEKIRFVEDRMKTFQASANEETKSSAGDKYETGRAMMHLEKEKMLSQLSEFSKLKKTLLQISKSVTETVQLGSLIFTEKGSCFFVSAGLGVVDVNNQKVFCVSVLAPLCKMFLGKKTGDTIIFNGQNHTIKALG